MKILSQPSIMAAMASTFSSSSSAFNSTFPPLPTRSSPLIPPDPPPPKANPSCAIPSFANSSVDNLTNSNLDNSRSANCDVPDSNNSVNPNLVSSRFSFPSFTKVDYASLFKALPKNAEVYQPQHFDIPRDGQPTPVPDLIKKEGLNYWSSYLIGFFLDGSLSYLSVVNFLNRYWKLQGEVDIKYDGTHFYFKFSNDDDRDRILKSDPIFIRGRMFIISNWDPSIGNTQSQIRKVPLWIHFYRIPMILWTLLGINWIVCHVGKLICFDNSTERRQRFRYAKALVEITPDFELPESLKFTDLGDNCPPVKLSYDWKPKICTFCKAFGHDTISCEFNPNADKNLSNQSKDSMVNGENTNIGRSNRVVHTSVNQANWAYVKTKKFWKRKEVKSSNAEGTVDMDNVNQFEVLNNDTIDINKGKGVNDKSGVIRPGVQDGSMGKDVDKGNDIFGDGNAVHNANMGKENNGDGLQDVKKGKDDNMGNVFVVDGEGVIQVHGNGVDGGNRKNDLSNAVNMEIEDNGDADSVIHEHSNGFDGENRNNMGLGDNAETMENSSDNLPSNRANVQQNNSSGMVSPDKAALHNDSEFISKSSKRRSKRKKAAELKVQSEASGRGITE